MNWDSFRVGLPNGAAVLALALVPVVAIVLGPIDDQGSAGSSTTRAPSAFTATADASHADDVEARS